MYALTFGRVTIGLVFVFSFVGKVTDLRRFEQAVSRFALLPSWLNRTAALLIPIGELLVVLLMFTEGRWLRIGFILAALLLVLFGLALLSVLVRHIETSCNCFGSKDTKVSWHDVVRNAGLAVVAILGYATSQMPSGMGQLSGMGYLLAGIFAVFFTTVWLNLRQITSLFEPLKGVEKGL